MNFMHLTLPRELAEFLDFHHYELTYLLESMARQFSKEGDHVLSEGHPVVFSPLQVMWYGMIYMLSLLIIKLIIKLQVTFNVHGIHIHRFNYLWKKKCS